MFDQNQEAGLGGNFNRVRKMPTAEELLERRAAGIESWLAERTEEAVQEKRNELQRLRAALELLKGDK